MKEAFRLIGTLALFCVGAGFLLAMTNNVTKIPIEVAQKAELLDALKAVLPDAANDVVADAVNIPEDTSVEDGPVWTFYVAKDANGKHAGTAFVSVCEKGYGGPVKVIVSLTTGGEIGTVRILEAAKETPGLGTKIKEPKFLDQFAGKPATDSKWAAVKKDGGQIVAVTGATISSRAVVQALKAGIEVYAKNEKKIAGNG